MPPSSGPSTGAAGGEAYRDPFDPDFWTKQVEVKDAGNTVESDVAIAANAAAEEKFVPEETSAKALQNQANAEDRTENEAAAEDRQQEAEALKAEIERELGGEAGRLLEGLVVAPAEGGLLVTISEQTDAPMFAVGSAVPQKELVLAMEKIGRLLAQRPGAVAVRGHTDGRPFKDGTYDNWRLSAARAQSAYYMLVRGGLKEERVKQISGFADRRLQVPNDPYAPANRRIEILLQSGQG